MKSIETIKGEFIVMDLPTIEEIEIYGHDEGLTTKEFELYCSEILGCVFTDWYSILDITENIASSITGKKVNSRDDLYRLLEKKYDIEITPNTYIFKL